MEQFYFYLSVKGQYYKVHDEQYLVSNGIWIIWIMYLMTYRQKCLRDKGLELDFPSKNEKEQNLRKIYNQS